ncbi:MAG TPA: tetratricopeptide repeat protein [Burkholderiales bacterium]|jgi:tetratricopeptide (TPR) repeat protein
MSTREARQAATLLESGLRQIRQGQFEQARLSCQRVLELAPRHPDALHLLGIIALQRGDHAGAVEKILQAIAIRPDDAAYHANLAHAYAGLQRLPEALAAFERAGRLDRNDPDIQLGIGNCLGMMGRGPEAEAVLRSLVEKHPRYALGWFNLAKSQEIQKRYEDACASYRRAIELAPRSADAYHNMGVALNRLQRYEEAEQAFRGSLAADPGFAPSRVGLAVALNFLRRHDEAEAQCREAIRLAPGERGARAMLAKSLSGQGRWAEALQWFEAAISEAPEDPELLSYLADALARNGRIAEALDAFDLASRHGTGTSADQSVPFGRAIALFSAGRIREGAAAWFGRDKTRALPAGDQIRAPAIELPRDLTGARVCLVGEQGLGDELFFLRYVPRLKARGCRVIYHGGTKIKSILARCPALDEALEGIAPLSPADQTVLVGDLPYLLGGHSETTSFPATGGMSRTRFAGNDWKWDHYWRARAFWPELPLPLRLEPVPELLAAVSERLRQLGPPPYLGLTWRAGTDIDTQRGRVWQLYKEAPFEPLAAAMRAVAGTLVSVQRNPRTGETQRLAALIGKPVHDLSAANEDLEEMLALLDVLDDYIGVSNTNMHLRAGAGKTARVLVPWPAEWRWMIAGGTSPWFPGFRIYRQRPDGDWKEALTALAADLQSASGRVR